jgi:tetratricopeptide (TPR) repeat protein
MDRVYVTNKELTPIFYNSVFLLLERGLVVGDVKLVEKWGFRFRKNGQPSSRYAEGLYIYASMFYEIGRYQDANFILSLALKENPPKVVEDKILRLRDFIQKSG